MERRRLLEGLIVHEPRAGPPVASLICVSREARWSVASSAAPASSAELNRLIARDGEVGRLSDRLRTPTGPRRGSRPAPRISWHRFEGALNTSKAAVEEGIVPGGGVALLNIAKALDRVDVQEADEKKGVTIVPRAIEEPATWLAANAGMEGAVVVEHIKAEKPRVGYDVAEGRLTNMLKAGLVDATKVTRLALQNAASVASLLLATEALVVEMTGRPRRVRGGYNPDDMNM